MNPLQSFLNKARELQQEWIVNGELCSFAVNSLPTLLEIIEKQREALDFYGTEKFYIDGKEYDSSTYEESECTILCDEGSLAQKTNEANDRLLASLDGK